MAFGIHHVHLKTRDPKQTMQFYVDNLGATLLADLGSRGYRVNLHGLTLNIRGKRSPIPTFPRPPSRFPPHSHASG